MILSGQRGDQGADTVRSDQTVTEHGRDEFKVLGPSRCEFRACQIIGVQAECNTTPGVVVDVTNQALPPSVRQGARLRRKSVCIVAMGALEQGDFTNGPADFIDLFRSIERAKIGFH